MCIFGSAVSVFLACLTWFKSSQSPSCLSPFQRVGPLRRPWRRSTSHAPPSPYSVFFILAAMKFFVFQAVTLPALVCAHGIYGARHHARQDASSVSASGNGVLIPDTTTPPTGTVSLTFSLASTNPTAVPLTYIASGVSTQPTIAISTTYAAGSKPTQIPNAPPLPNGTYHHST